MSRVSRWSLVTGAVLALVRPANANDTGPETTQVAVHLFNTAAGPVPAPMPAGTGVRARG